MVNRWVNLFRTRSRGWGARPDWIIAGMRSSLGLKFVKHCLVFLSRRIGSPAHRFLDLLQIAVELLLQIAQLIGNGVRFRQELQWICCR